MIIKIKYCIFLYKTCNLEIKNTTELFINNKLKGQIKYHILNEVKQTIEFNLGNNKICVLFNSKKDYSDFIDGIQDTCPICFEPLFLRGMTCIQCKHKFHDKCLKRWYEKKDTCPMCRNSENKTPIQTPNQTPNQTPHLDGSEGGGDLTNFVLD